LRVTKAAVGRWAIAIHLPDQRVDLPSRERGGRPPFEVAPEEGAYSTHRDHAVQRIVITPSTHRDHSDHDDVIGAQRR